ncbi:MAG: serine hydrolase, partial [Christensenellaceae bacterium]|nr:serine hydrolase [Christensenellaceae bacterium]
RNMMTARSCLLQRIVSDISYILAVILQKLTGMTVFEYLKPRLFRPLGIENATWQESPEGVTVAGWGLDITLEDLAKFGQFLLQKGMWEGKQLLSSAWIEEATACHIKIGNPDASWNEEFGYQIWLCEHPGAYNGVGAFGQRYIVIPDKDAVITFYSGSADVSGTLDAIWQKLVPAMADEPLPADQAGQAALAKKAQAVRIAPPKGMYTSPIAQQVSGVGYELSPNYTGIDYIKFDFDPEGDRAVIGFKGDCFGVNIGHDAWEDGKTCVKTADTDTDVTIVYESISCAGAWVGENTYQLRMCFDETSYINTMDITFLPHGVRIHHTRNVSFMESTDLTIVGMKV